MMRPTNRPTAFLKTSPQATRMLVHAGDGDVLKAVLSPPCWSPPHIRALPTLLEGVALWHQTQVHVVLDANEAESWFRLGLINELHLGLPTAHYTVEVREPAHDRRRRHRIDGFGSFVDLRQLRLRGTR